MMNARRSTKENGTKTDSAATTRRVGLKADDAEGGERGRPGFVDPLKGRPGNRYNLYYTLERQLLLQSSPGYKRIEGTAALVSTSSEPIVTGYEGLQGVPPLPPRYAGLDLPDDWYMPGKRKLQYAPHKKSHGLPSFQHATKMIAEGWKSVDDETLAYCTTLARLLKQRHGDLWRAAKGEVPRPVGTGDGGGTGSPGGEEHGEEPGTADRPLERPADGPWTDSAAVPGGGKEPGTSDRPAADDRGHLRDRNLCRRGTDKPEGLGDGGTGRPSGKPGKEPGTADRPAVDDRGGWRDCNLHREPDGPHKGGDGHAIWLAATRVRMVHRIVQLLNEGIRGSAFPEGLAGRIRNEAKCIEEMLFVAAPSVGAYLNGSSLERRARTAMRVQRVGWQRRMHASPQPGHNQQQQLQVATAQRHMMHLKHLQMCLYSRELQQKQHQQHHHQQGYQQQAQAQAEAAANAAQDPDADRGQLLDYCRALAREVARCRNAATAASARADDVGSGVDARWATVQPVPPSPGWEAERAGSDVGRDLRLEVCFSPPDDNGPAAASGLGNRKRPRPDVMDASLDGDNARCGAPPTPSPSPEMDKGGPTTNLLFPNAKAKVPFDRSGSPKGFKVAIPDDVPSSVREGPDSVPPSWPSDKSNRENEPTSAELADRVNAVLLEELTELGLIPKNLSLPPSGKGRKNPGEIGGQDRSANVDATYARAEPVDGSPFSQGGSDRAEGNVILPAPNRWEGGAVTGPACVADPHLEAGCAEFDSDPLRCDGGESDVSAGGSLGPVFLCTCDIGGDGGEGKLPSSSLSPERRANRYFSEVGTGSTLLPYEGGSEHDFSGEYGDLRMPNNDCAYHSSDEESFYTLLSEGLNSPPMAQRADVMARRNVVIRNEIDPNLLLQEQRQSAIEVERRELLPLSISSRNEAKAVLRGCTDWRASRKEMFPDQLFAMLEYTAENPEWKCALSWSPDGASFSINNWAKFQELSLSREFFRPKMNKLKSFQRHLSMWGFKWKTISGGEMRVMHDQFVRKNSIESLVNLSWSRQSDLGEKQLPKRACSEKIKALSNGDQHPPCQMGVGEPPQILPGWLDSTPTGQRAATAASRNIATRDKLDVNLRLQVASAKETERGESPPLPKSTKHGFEDPSPEGMASEEFADGKTPCLISIAKTNSAAIGWYRRLLLSREKNTT